MKSPRAVAFSWLLASVFVVGACSTTSSTPTADTPQASAHMTHAIQEAMTPDQALGRLTAGNERFVAGTSLHHDYRHEAEASLEHQYPFAAVISCMDSRSAPEIVFDQGIGDIFVARVAGNYAPVDIAGSMEYATKVAGAKLIVIMGHTSCGAVKGACDNVQLGNLTTVIQAIRPAVEEVQNVPGERNSKNKEFVDAVVRANVRRTVVVLRRESPILREMEEKGEIKIIGAVHDLATGKVTILSETPSGQSSNLNRENMAPRA